MRSAKGNPSSLYDFGKSLLLAWDILQIILTTTAAKGENLLILGHPKKAYWKMMHNTYDYALIEGFPKMMAVFLLANLLVILVIYMVATSGILKSVRPIVKGIEELPNKEVYVKEKGLFSQLAEAMNQVSEKLRTQERELKRRESARANWISGVSHDIRTPLSMVMGYAAQLEENQSLPLEERKKQESSDNRVCG